MDWKFWQWPGRIKKIELALWTLCNSLGNTANTEAARKILDLK